MNAIIEGLKFCAKELSDSEIIDLYKKVKEKLDGADKNEDQVLDGEKSGVKPMEPENNSMIPNEAPESDDNKETDAAIDQLLNDIGLSESPEEPKTEEKEASVEQVPVEKESEEQELPFDVSEFKTAARGQQLNRKDKDLMSDDATGPKYEDPDSKPPRYDSRRPNGIRWKKNESDRDPDVDSDKDMKL